MLKYSEKSMLRQRMLFINLNEKEKKELTRYSLDSLEPFSHLKLGNAQKFPDRFPI